MTLLQIWDANIHTILAIGYLNKFTHTCTQAQIYIYINIWGYSFWNTHIKCIVISHWARVEPWGVVGSISPGPSLAFSGSPLSIVNMRVGELRDVSHSKGDAGNSPLSFRKAQKVSPRTTAYRVPKNFALDISKFPSWPQYRSIIAVIFKSPVTMVPFHSGYKLGTEWAKAVMGWWISSFSPLWSGNRSTCYDQCCPHLSRVRVPAAVNGHFS